MAFRWPWEIYWESFHARINALETQQNANALSLGGQTNLAGGARPTGAAGPTGALGGTFPAPTLNSGLAPMYQQGVYEGTGSSVRPFIATSNAQGGWTPRAVFINGTTATTVITVAHATFNNNLSGNIVGGLVRDIVGASEAAVTSAMIGINNSGVAFGLNAANGLNQSGVLYSYSILG